MKLGMVSLLVIQYSTLYTAKLHLYSIHLFLLPRLLDLVYPDIIVG